MEKKEEEQECYKISNEKKSNDIVMRNEKHECKENDSYEDVGNHENVQLIKKIKGNVEKACVVHEHLQKDSVCTEVRYKILVENLKEELFRVMHDNEYEHSLEVEDTMKKIEKEFYLALEKNLLKDKRRL